MERELRLIYEGQNTIHRVVAQLDAKLNQIIQSQQQLAARGGGAPAQPGQPGQPMDTFTRIEVNEQIRLTKEIDNYVRDVKSYVLDIHQKAANIETRVASQGVGSVQAAGGTAQGQAGSDQFQFQSVKTYLEGIKHDVEQLRLLKPPPPAAGGRIAGCPDISCLTPTLFFICLAVQSTIFVMFSCLRGRNEKAKFY